MKPSRSESEVKAEVGRLLSSLGILWFRMNTGMAQAEHNGRRRFIRYGTPGMADILAFPGKNVLWIETKRERGGVQSPNQKMFEDMVRAQGHGYLIATRVDQVWNWIKWISEEM